MQGFFFAFSSDSEAGSRLASGQLGDIHIFIMPMIVLTRKAGHLTDFTLREDVRPLFSALCTKNS